MIAVLDASALLAVLFGERGRELVEETRGHALMSAVNMAEAYAKLSDRGTDDEEIRTTLESISVKVIDFDDGQAIATGGLRKMTRKFGLSLGGRACIALAIQQKLPVMTADRTWGNLDLGIEIKIIR